WKTESNPTQQTVLSLLGVAVGLALSIGFRRFEGLGLTSSLAGFVLGLLILTISAAMLLKGGKRTITVDPKTRRIILEDMSRIGKKTRSLLFDEIAEFYVDELGDKEGGSIQYFVVAKLKTGQKVSLFLGFFDGRYDRDVMETRCRRLAEYLRP
ncbi:MAG TPA: hypothetical protein VF417_01400, partial [Candidatus Methylomirabilis sp.]